MASGVSSAVHLPSRFSVLSELGRGTFGVVLRCHDTVYTSEVAVKVIESAAFKAWQARSGSKITGDQEFLVASRLSHPGIVTMLDLLSVRDRWCVVMELVPGVCWFDYLVETGPLPPRETLLCMHCLLKALSYCHGVGVIHRDVKPENAILVPGSCDLLKLVDFGVAAACAGNLCYSRVGSSMYMAPEVIRASSVSSDSTLGYDCRADVWSAGICLYVVWCAELPYDEGWFPTTSPACFEIDFDNTVWRQDSSTAARRIVSHMTTFDAARRPVSEELAAVAYWLSADDDLPCST